MATANPRRAAPAVGLALVVAVVLAACNLAAATSHGGSTTTSAVAPAGHVAKASTATTATTTTGMKKPMPGAGGLVGGPIHLASKPTRYHPLRVVLIGDSVMRGEAPAIAAAFGSTKVVATVNDGFDGWGFTTDTGWRTGVPAAITGAKAAVVIAMWSYDDSFLAAHPVLYHRWMVEFVHLVLAQHGVAGLVFEQFPQLGPVYAATVAEAKADARRRNEAVDEWNHLVRSMVHLDPSRIVYAPLAPSVERGGRFVSFLPPGDDWRLPLSKWLRVRSKDAVHLCQAGAARYANALLYDFTDLFGLPAASATWQSGAWNDDVNAYGTADQGCPHDHP